MAIKEKKKEEFPLLATMPGVAQAKDVGTAVTNIGKRALEYVSGTTGIPRGEYLTPEQIKTGVKTWKEGMGEIRGEAKKVAIGLGGVPKVSPTKVSPTVRPTKTAEGLTITYDEKGNPIFQGELGLGQKVGKKGIPTAFDVPEEFRGKLGRYYLTNKGRPDFAKEASVRAKVKGVPAPIGGTGMREANRLLLEAGKLPTETGGGIPKMDFSNWPNILKSLQSLVPFAAKTGIAKDRLKREKDALSMGLDKAKLNKAVAETMALPIGEAEKRSKIALNVAKTKKEGLDFWIMEKAMELAKDPLTNTLDPTKIDEYATWLRGNFGGDTNNLRNMTTEELEEIIRTGK